MMKRNNSKSFLYTSILSVIAFGAVGCGSGNPTPTSAPIVTQPAATTVAPTYNVAPSTTMTGTGSMIYGTWKQVGSANASVYLQLTFSPYQLTLAQFCGSTSPVAAFGPVSYPSANTVQINSNIIITGAEFNLGNIFNLSNPLETCSARISSGTASYTVQSAEIGSTMTIALPGQSSMTFTKISY